MTDLITQLLNVYQIISFQQFQNSKVIKSQVMQKEDVENRKIDAEDISSDDQTNFLNEKGNLMQSNALSFETSQNRYDKANKQNQSNKNSNNQQEFEYFFDNILTIKIPFTKLKYEVTYCQTSKTILGGVMLFFIIYVYYMLYCVFTETKKH
ncbi:transmembrane protein, putative (macronuclear) [Tetrahymena thermophila SB210]|uniref:Transmembrane protein, putative n=1 Tax=Tetrahymena thermophila (strain SB210) TaxID=312017 RepID=Q239Z9_TETTS|nr:transmembrane protein, putative [Tetrahymena thermophila SB210]EAR93364.3 transmembrane protein, putative [Tetrahymena thermophila SB210]|eukprot:XP_001013609.3 transmembrane protein, putative [Tetrahymena thermophila SB210]